MNNDDKTFEILEKLYVHIQDEFKQIRTDMNTGFAALKLEIGAGFQKVEGDISRIENNFNVKMDASSDRYDNISEDIKEIKQDIRKIAEKLQNQEVEVKVLKAVK